MQRIETETDARQGRKGKPVLAVLIGALALCAVAAVGVLAWQSANTPPDRSSQSQATARGTTAGDTTGSVSSERSGNPAPAKPR